MAQLGAGFGSSYPSAIDTKQTFRNIPTPVPDSDTRLDSELANDTLSSIVQMQTALGAKVQGQYGSLAARLAQFIPGGASIPNVLSFAGQSTVMLAGAVHQQPSPAMLYQVWDTSTPRHGLEPQTVTVAQNNYDLTMTFGTSQSGTVVLGAPPPLYITRFVDALTLTIPGTAHGLPYGTLFYQVYDDADPAHALDPGPLTIHPTTYDVTLYFAARQSGLLILSAGGPRYEHAFPPTTSFTVSGATHGLGSAALLYQLYDTQTPRAAFQPADITVDPVTFDVVVSLGASQGGVLVLSRVAPITGQEFELRDAGVVNQSATRLYSASGQLNLQTGPPNRLYVRAANGTTTLTIDTQFGRLGVGQTLTNPTFQIQLLTDSAAKPASSAWTIFSDATLKTDVEPFTPGLEVIEQLVPVWYRYNGLGGMPTTGPPNVGLLAQALQPIAPYMVGSTRGKLQPTDTQETDILTYNGHAMTFVLINAVQALAQRLASLEAAYAELQAHLTPAPAGEETPAC